VAKTLAKIGAIFKPYGFTEHEFTSHLRQKSDAWAMLG